MAAVRQAQRDGLVRHVGFSTHGFREVIEAAISTDHFDFVNLHYYFFFQRHDPILTLATQRDMGVFIISPGDKGGMLYTPPAKLKKPLCPPFPPGVDLPLAAQRSQNYNPQHRASSPR